MNPAKLLALLFLVITLPLQAQPASVSYIPEMEYLRLAPGVQLTPQQAMASVEWQVLPEKTPNFGYIRDHIWLRFPVSNPELITLLEISYPQLDHVDFYLIRDSNIVHHESTGDQKPFRERPVQHPHFLFPF
ncbi:MAG: diguanylate cyclase, partial [Marinobacter sp.]|nr:diguanylate cyclase [Marinobacter sp.]